MLAAIAIDDGSNKKRQSNLVALPLLSSAISQCDSEITDDVTVGAMAQIVEKRGVDVEADKTDSSVCQREMDSSHVRGTKLVAIVGTAAARIVHGDIAGSADRVGVPAIGETAIIRPVATTVRGDRQPLLANHDRVGSAVGDIFKRTRSDRCDSVAVPDDHSLVGRIDWNRPVAAVPELIPGVG